MDATLILSILVPEEAMWRTVYQQKILFGKLWASILKEGSWKKACFEKFFLINLLIL